MLFQLTARQGGSLESTVGSIKAEICSVNFGLNERPPACAGRKLNGKSEVCDRAVDEELWDTALQVPQITACLWDSGSGFAFVLLSYQHCSASTGSRDVLPWGDTPQLPSALRAS